jgi:hypothetical protein
MLVAVLSFYSLRIYICWPRPPIQVPSASILPRSLPAGIAKLFASDCEALAKAGSCRHFGGVIGPEAEGIGAGVAV